MSFTSPRATRRNLNLADKNFKEVAREAVIESNKESQAEVIIDDSVDSPSVQSVNSVVQSQMTEGRPPNELTESQLDDLNYVIRGKLQKKDIMSLFKRVEEKETSHVGGLFECLFCGMQRRQVEGHGASNLKRHLNTMCSEKDTWEKRLRLGEFLDVSKKKRQATITGFQIDPNAIFLRLAIEDQLPFSICQSPSLRRLCVGLKVPHRTTLVKMMFSLFLNCKQKLIDELSNVTKFSLMLDGWSRHSKHYVCVVICYSLLNKPYNERLLCFRTLPKEVSMSAEDHIELLDEVMADYGLRLDNCVALVGDHASVNTKMSKLLKIPLIGCWSHRLNLGVKEVFKNDKELSRCLRKVHNYMSFLKTNKGAAHLEQEVGGAPGFKAIIENKTRWTSSFQMLERYAKQEDQGLVKKMTIARRDILGSAKKHLYRHAELSQSESVRVTEETRKMKEVLHKATNMLQERGLTCSKGKLILDMVTANYPALETWFQKFKDKGGIPSESFENGLVKLQRNEADTLTRDEEKAVRKLLLKKGNRAPSTEEDPKVLLCLSKRW